jgi:hypothetical protein
MRGTTPTIEIEIDTEDFLLSELTAIELYVRNGNKISTYTKDDLIVDEESNVVSKQLTEADTKALDPQFPVIVQMRGWYADGNVIGIEKLVFDTADMEGE